jgi:phenylacetate-coenzyme A ligase PaaK-like adenylate-forming protein
MTLGGKVKKGLLKREIERRLEEYGKPYRDEEVRDVQLALFNGCWRKMVREIPFYRHLQRQRGIPETISSWEDFLELFPVVRRQDIQKNGAAMTDPSRKPDCMRVTSGTTARPIQLPAWSSEFTQTRPDRWYARTWYGIQPDDRGFLLWNNQSLECGIKREIDLLKQGLFDKVAGDCRISNYNISEDRLREAGQRLIKHKPGYIYACSMTMDAFARANAHRGEELRALGIKAVIGASEGFPSRDSIELVEELFGCPVAMEYGSVETGAMAHTHPDGPYRVFWRNFFLEACEEGPGGNRILRVTSLYERCFPLVRYEIGDEIEPLDEGDEFGLRCFGKVGGRISSCVVLRDGTKIHVGAFPQCVRDVKEVLAYQLVRGRDDLSFNLLMEDYLSKSVEERIRTRLYNIHPLLADVGIEAVDALMQTTAGKTPAVIDEPEPGT